MKRIERRLLGMRGVWVIGLGMAREVLIVRGPGGRRVGESERGDTDIPERLILACGCQSSALRQCKETS